MRKGIIKSLLWHGFLCVCVCVYIYAWLNVFKNTVVSKQACVWEWIRKATPHTYLRRKPEINVPCFLSWLVHKQIHSFALFCFFFVFSSSFFYLFIFFLEGCFWNDNLSWKTHKAEPDCVLLLQNKISEDKARKAVYNTREG